MTLIDTWPKLRAQLIEHEGVRLKPYVDTVGKLTIGCGRNLTDVGISQDECDLMLDNDIGRSIAELRGAFAWFNGLNDIRQRVLIDLEFNIGMTRLLGFHLMTAAIVAGDFEEAARQMLDSTWSKQVGDRAQRLAKMMATGCE